MREPTAAELEASRPGTCTRCGNESGPTGRNTAGECMECHNRGYHERKEARKKELAALPRCEVAGCKRRGTWTCQGALMCGGHLKRARGKVAATGILGFLAADSIDRNIILKLAE